MGTERNWSPKQLEGMCLEREHGQVALSPGPAPAPHLTPMQVWGLRSYC